MCRLADWCVLILLGIAGVMDWKKREVPIWLLILISAVVFIITICCDRVNVWFRLAGAGLGLVFFLISRVTKEAVGYADSWLILVLGIHLGIFFVLQVLFAASFMAAIAAVFYLWKRNWRRSETLPFIPFLVLAYIGVICV